MKSALSGLLLVFIVVGCSSAAASHTITGTITFPGVSDRFPGVVTPPAGECAGVDTFGSGDLQTGMQVLVVDEAGKTIGSGRLKNTSAPHTNGVCSAEFSIDVPDATFYQVRLGARKTEQYAAADLATGGWRVDLAIQRQ